MVCQILAWPSHLLRYYQPKANIDSQHILLLDDGSTRVGSIPNLSTTSANISLHPICYRRTFYPKIRRRPIRDYPTASSRFISNHSSFLLAVLPESISRSIDLLLTTG
jgi:hypothetical protein